MNEEFEANPIVSYRELELGICKYLHCIIVCKICSINTYIFFQRKNGWSLSFITWQETRILGIIFINVRFNISVVYSFIQLFISSFLHFFIASSFHFFISWFLRLFIYSSIHFFVSSFLHFFIYSVLHLFIYSLIHYYYCYYWPLVEFNRWGGRGLSDTLEF